MIDRFDMEAVFYVVPCFFAMFSAQDEPDTIGPEGVEKLCKDLGVEPEDVRMSYLFITLVGKCCILLVKLHVVQLCDISRF